MLFLAHGMNAEIKELTSFSLRELCDFLVPCLNSNTRPPVVGVSLQSLNR